MQKASAGVLVWRKARGSARGAAGVEVFLVHPGGPFWARKDWGAWSIPKGEFADGEDPLEAARREFREETGQDAPDASAYLPLAPVRQPGGKVVHAFAVEGEVDAARVRSNEFEMEWPPRSGTVRRFPEVDRGAWFRLAEARERIMKGQLPILDELAARFAAGRR
jgi:predicted NUDIX family NTP pyrophosphohydrolase